MTLETLFHWSPHDRFHAISMHGLAPYTPPRIETINEELGTKVAGWPYICLGTTPSSAWSLSGDMDEETEVDGWDLWQVNLVDTDEVHVRSEWGPVIHEVRVHNAIGADRIWWVATRTPPSALEVPVEVPRTPRRKRRAA